MTSRHPVLDLVAPRHVEADAAEPEPELVQARVPVQAEPARAAVVLVLVVDLVAAPEEAVAVLEEVLADREDPAGSGQRSGAPM